MGLTWCTKTSTGDSKGLPSRLLMEMNPNPILTLNHLQWPVPCKTWDSSSSSCSGNFPGSSPPLLAPAEEEGKAEGGGVGGEKRERGGQDAKQS